MFARISLLLFLFSLFLSPFTTSATTMCAQVIQYAENTTTSECQAFPTPCDVPTGWKPVTECSLSAPAKFLTTQFQVQKFASCDDLESRLLEITKRYQTQYWYSYPIMYAR